MRVTKKVIAKICNEFLTKVELPFSVDYTDIERTYFNSNDYEGGATFHIIIAKDDKGGDIQYG